MIRLTLPLCLAATLLSACASGGDVSRSVNPMTDAPQAKTVTMALPMVMAPRFDVRAVSVTVPQSLSVSEANMFYPIADIVWRGEPLADRHVQVKAIFDDAATQAVAGMHQGPAAVVEIEVERFHSVTEKTRYTVGGVHDMKYRLTVRDAETGAVLDGPREVRADVKAAGGARAVAEEQAGRTQRVVIVERLVASLRQELSAQVTDPLLVSKALSQSPADLVAMAD